MNKPRAAGDFDRLRGSSCQPTGVGGIGVRVLKPGLRVGGAGTLTVCRFTFVSMPGPKLWDLELLGGGPGGGGGKGIVGPQFPCCGEGEYSIGVLASVASPRKPAEAARREAGGLTGDSGLHWRSGA